MRVPVPGPQARERAVAAGWTLWVAALLLGGFGVLVLAVWYGVSPVAGAATGAAVALVGWWWVRRARRVHAGLTPPMLQTSAAERAVPVPASAPDGMQACMRCGSTELAIPGIRDGVWVGGGELQLMVCRNCNSRGPPLLFDRGEDYVAFVRELHEGAGARP